MKDKPSCKTHATAPLALPLILPIVDILSGL